MDTHSHQSERVPERKEDIVADALSKPENINEPESLATATNPAVRVIESQHIRAIIRIAEVPVSHVVDVSFEAHTTSGHLVATYTTADRIHPAHSRSVLDHLDNIRHMLSPRQHIEDIYGILSSKSLTRWNVTPAERQPPPDAESVEQVTKLKSAVPRIEDLLKNPENIDNYFTTRWISNQALVRIGAVLEPERGYATVAIDLTSSNTDDPERTLIKLLIPPEGEFSVAEVRRILLNQVRAVASEMYAGGLEQVFTYLKSDPSLYSIALTGGIEQINRIDESILAGGSAGLLEARHTSYSGVNSSLVIGKRVAVLTISPIVDNPGVKYRVVFECQKLDRQLSASQIHHLTKMYELMSSDGDEQLHEGILMCLDARSKIKRRPVIHSAYEYPGTGGRLDFLTVTERPLQYQLADLIGHERVQRIERLHGVTVKTEQRLSNEVLRSALNGSVMISIDRPANTNEAVNPEEFQRMRLYMLSNDLIDIAIINGLESSFTGRIRTAEVSGVNSAEAATMLIELFAEQPHSSWRLLLSKILLPESQMFGVHPFGLAEAWRNDFPPINDIPGIQMFEEVARFHSWIMAGVGGSAPSAELKYSGFGCVELTFKASPNFPALRIVFDNGILKNFEVTALTSFMTEGPSDKELLARFRSETLVIGSQAYQECIDNLSLAMRVTAINGMRPYGRPLRRESIKAIIDAVTPWMERVD